MEEEMMMQCFEPGDHCDFSFRPLMMMTTKIAVVVFVFVLIGSGFLWLIFLRCVKNTDYEKTVGSVLGVEKFHATIF